VALAIDGKQLNGSAKQNATVSHLLSVVSHELGVTIAQKAVDTKTNEIPISTEILSAFDIKGKIATTDALLTQRDFCTKVCALDGDYVVPVELNHKQLHQDIACLFNPPPDINTPEGTVNTLQQMHTELDQTLDTHQTVEKGHGRIEIRRLTASTALNEYIQWPGVNQVFEYSYQRIEVSTGQVKQNTQYSITSLTLDQASATDLLTLRRGHWTIENKSHWVRDVVLGEDASQVREGVIPQVMSALRNTALAVLRFAGHQHVSKATRYFAAHPQNALNLINGDTEN
jgi:predicted transposase YbfD/YdcC